MPVRARRCLLLALALTLISPAMARERRNPDRTYRDWATGDWGTGDWGHGRRPVDRNCCEGYGWGGYRGRPYPPYPTYPFRPYDPPPRVVLPPRAWPPPTVVVPVQPPLFQGRPPAEFVYWCDSPTGYYPNVTTCNGPWRERSAAEPR